MTHNYEYEEQEARREAISQLYRREAKPGMFLTAGYAAWFFAKLLFWSAVVWAVIVGCLAL